MNARVPFAAAQRAFGVAATVTIPDGSPVSTTAVWLSPDTVQLPGGLEFQRSDSRRVIALSREDVPSIPRSTVIVAPEPQGDTNKTWRVDGTVRIEEGDHLRVSVIEAS